MQIDVDFEVFQYLTFLRRDEGDTINHVLRRLLSLSETEKDDASLRDRLIAQRIPKVLSIMSGTSSTADGTWIGNVFFPNGTKFRATYKGRTYRAEIRNELWIGEDGKERQSPSQAAHAVCGTNVNGWRFWYGLRPGDEDWRRLDEFRK